MRESAVSLTLCIGLTWTVAARSGEFEVVEPKRATPKVQRIGPPTYYALDKARYHEFRQHPPDRRYPIPQQKITRETYYKWLEDSGHIDYVDNADRHGIYGPRHLTPVLAAYVKTGERRYGDACITMLKAYHESLKQAVAKDGWHSNYMDEPGYIGLYRRYLTKGGLLDPERDEWFREFILFMNRNIHVWGTPQTYWRGPMHRAQGEGVMKGLDPAADKANICCGLIVTDKTLPAKLVLRSGWNPGDLFALVDLFPRHDPLNVPGILGITRHGVGLTSTVPAKGFSDENRLVIEDLSGTAPLRWNTDPELADSYYQAVTIPRFHDGKRATFASIVVADYQGYPVKATRQIAFIKNRFIVVRDIAEFEEGFLAEIGPVFNSENIGPQIGPHWANTFIKSPKYLNYPLKNPPYDLLVYFVPQPSCVMQVVDRTAVDPRTSYVPGQVRYQWRGVTQPGQKLLFTQVFYPHEPRAILHASTAAGGDRTADLIGTAGADAITVVRDTAETTVLRCEFEENRVEWIVFNPDGQNIEADAVVLTHVSHISTSSRTKPSESRQKAAVS